MRKLPELQFSRIPFDNGLILLVFENPKVPLVSLNAFVRAGSDQNPRQQPGLASLTARMLEEGTRNFRARAIAQRIEDSGGTLNTFSHREFSGLSINLLSSELETGVELVAEMLRCPTFPEGRLKREKEHLINDLQSLEDDPHSVAAMLFDRLIFEPTSLQYPVAGTRSAVSGIKPDDLHRFHGEKYAPNNTILVAAGAVSAELLLHCVQRHLANWSNSSFKPVLLQGLKRQREPRLRTRPMGREQAQIMMGHLGVRRTDPDFPALEVLDIVLGSGPGFTSRIPRKLRDDQGLAYSTYCNITNSSGTYPGRFIGYISTAPENCRQAIRGMHEEWIEITTRPVSSQELKAAQDYLTGSFVFDFQSNASVARFLLSSEVFGLGTDYLRDYPEMICNVSAEKVLQVARKHLDTVNYTTVIVGPSSSFSCL